MVKTLKMKGTVKALKILALIGITSLLANLQSRAATDLHLTEGQPDLAGGTPGMDVTYDVGTGAFSSSGYTFDYVDASGNDYANNNDIVPGIYTLSATINNSGVLLPGGTLSIYGDINPAGDGSTLLLSGNLVNGSAGTAFGYGDNVNDQFQFLFKVSGGSLESAFGGNGATGGIILEAAFNLNSGSDHPFTGSWTSSFDNLDSAGDPGSGNGLINSFSMVPEPSSFLLVLVGSGLLVGGYRCRRNSLSV